MGYFNQCKAKPESTNVLISTIFFDKKMAPSLHAGCYHERIDNDVSCANSNATKSFRYNKFSNCSIDRRRTANKLLHNVCYVSVILSFILGVTTGVFIPLYYLNSSLLSNNQSSIQSSNNTIDTRLLENNYSANKLIRSVFVNNSYSNVNNLNNLGNINNLNESSNRTTPSTSTTEYQTVMFIDPELNENLNDLNSDKFKYDDESDGPSKYDSEIIKNGIYWGSLVERSLPSGYDDRSNTNWYHFLNKSVAVKLEPGCGRMQNRLVTFKDGTQACARYRQNTDQIQGELFSFYLAQILNLPNLAPSAISIVDLNDPNWKYLSNEIANAQWNANRAVVLTKYIPNLDSAFIPKYFKPTDRHLNKHDVRNLTGIRRKSDVVLHEDSNVFNELIELAQWSDLIIFDYLTANLDRIVNNLYNYQWNVNIMDAPAHNLARKLDSNLLVFLDNESGLLHGYRLLDKYETYHRLLLDNLCIFRKSTVDIIKNLKREGNIGTLLKNMFYELNSDKVKDILPVLPDKSIKILSSRIDKVYKQITRCESIYYEKQF